MGDLFFWFGEVEGQFPIFLHLYFCNNSSTFFLSQNGERAGCEASKKHFRKKSIGFLNQK